MKFTLSCAESCTGGNIAHKITLVPGSSEYFIGGVVSYSNEMKHKVLGVPEDILDTYGAVSRPVVEAMATGVCNLTGSDYAIATSGIAGPGGAVPGKSVGSVWIAVCKGSSVVSGMYHFPGCRSEVIESATQAAFALLEDSFGVRIPLLADSDRGL